MDPSLSTAGTAPPQPTTYTLRCPWSVPLPSAPRPPRVVANADQLVILNALYARVGQDASKEQIEEASKATGLEDKWIRKWIKRKRAPRRSKGKKASQFIYASVPQGQPYRAEGSGSPGSGSAQAALNESMRPVFDLHSAGPAFHSPLGQANPVPGAFSNSGHDGSASPTRDHHSGGIDVNGFPLQQPAAPVALAHDARTEHLNVTRLQPAAPIVQVAHPGDSFTVPLRMGMSSYLSSDSPGVSTPGATHGAFCAGNGIHSVESLGMPSPALGYASDVSDSAWTSSPAVVLHNGVRMHYSQLDPLHIPNGGYPAPVFGGTQGFPGSPSTFMPQTPFEPGPGCLTTGAAYLYRLLHESAGNFAPPEVPQVPPTYDVEPLAEVPSEIWSPMPSFISPVNAGGSEASCFTVPAQPVSYRMQLSDLIALTKRVRAAPQAKGDASATGEAEEDELTKQSRPESPATAKCVASQTLTPKDNPGMTMDAHDSEDEEEVVTPCEERDLFPGLPTKGQKLGEPGVVPADASAADGGEL
ncbi:hypothetical protein FKP32DRAFT_1761646 [Trametes sanguinea]|nr:hypothetical protein FKP32DRAFT_1761646 [Trametes sanguinea]